MEPLSKDTISLDFAGTGKGQAEFLLAHFACKCNFPSHSSLKLLFFDLHLCFSHVPQVSLDNFLYSFFYGLHLKQCFQICTLVTVLSLQVCCFSPSRPGGRSPMQMGEEAISCFCMYPSFRKATTNTLIRVNKRRKSLSALPSNGGACNDEILLVLLHDCFIARPQL